MARSPDLKRTVSGIEAWLFDLDGVLTDTARVHAAAWKATFDEVLAKHCAGRDGAFREFDAVDDYERYVDGRPRYDGVRGFLASWGLTLPEGLPSDPPNLDTVRGAGKRKNARVLEHLGGCDGLPRVGGSRQAAPSRCTAVPLWCRQVRTARRCSRPRTSPTCSTSPSMD